MTLETELGLYVFSTAGSIEVGDNMKDYVLTAVATSVNHELNKSLSPMRNWSDSSFQTAVRTQLDHVMGAAGDFSRQKTLTFELLCAKRTTYLGKVHSELAVSYEQGGAFLLGICDHQCFIPHYELPLSDFPQPIWRKVSAAGEVFEIMHDMTDVVLGQMTEGAFGDKWFPGQRMNFHPEGWVFLDHKHCDAKFGPTYGKIKHPDYYRIHQFQKYGEARVLAYPEAVDKYYPTVARLRRFRQNTPEGVSGEHEDRPTGGGQLEVGDLQRTEGQSTGASQVIPRQAQPKGARNHLQDAGTRHRPQEQDHASRQHLRAERRGRDPLRQEHLDEVRAVEE